jgi:histidinol phosphatase-like enzyme (inositol monophosphatase family)
MIDEQALLARYDFACRIAAEAGQHTLKYFRSDFAVERKSDNSPVTIADREAEQLLRKLIGEAFPDDGIVGEEFPVKQGSGPFRWILDPIDGTKSFVAGVPLYGTLVGVQYAGESVAGVIEIPALGESVSARRGGGAWYRSDKAEPVRAHVSQCQRLSDAIFVTSERRTFDERPGGGTAYRRLEDACWVTRTWGDCYGYLLVATGRVDVMVDPQMSLWDAAALQPVIEEAGGSFSDWRGVATVDSGEAIACPPAIWPDVLKLLGSH